MSRTLAPSLLTALLAGCAPQTAQLIDGSYIAFLSDGTSLSLAKEEIDPADYSGSYNVDCREFETPEDEEALKLEDPIAICGPNVWPPQHEEWAVQSGFRVVHEDLAPWRGEAIITSEGDLQITFHHRAPGGADIRWAFSVDPKFQPTTCAPGSSDIIDLDGDWIENWSTELDWLAGQDDETLAAFEHMEPYFDGGRLFFLNAFGYQLNPSDVDDFWTLPQQWLSGATQGKFSEEFIEGRTPRFGEPYVYNYVEVASTPPEITEAEIWYCDMEAGADPLDSTCMQNRETRVRTVVSEIRTELDRLMTDDDDNQYYHYEPIAHFNTWRVPDGLPPGLDGWAEMHYNYVVFSGDSDLTEGGRAEGAFSLVLDAQDSTSRVFLKGRFEVPKIKKDRWTTADLRADKIEESGVTLCSGF